MTRLDSQLTSFLLQSGIITLRGGVDDGKFRGLLLIERGQSNLISQGIDLLLEALRGPLRLT